MLAKRILFIFSILSIGAGLVLFIVSFFSMYSLAGKCQDGSDVRSCEAYQNWQVGYWTALAMLFLGILALVVWFVLRRRK
jgi:hypothetical protein